MKIALLTWPNIYTKNESIFISINCYFFCTEGASSHALPSRVGWSDDSSGDPVASAQPNPKAKGRAAKKSKAKKKAEKPEDDHEPIPDGDGNDDDDDDDDIDPLGADDAPPDESISKKPATAKREVKKRPAGAKRSKGSKQSKDRDGMGTWNRMVLNTVLPNKHLYFSKIESCKDTFGSITSPQSFDLPPGWWWWWCWWWCWAFTIALWICHREETSVWWRVHFSDYFQKFVFHWIIISLRLRLFIKFMSMKFPTIRFEELMAMATPPKMLPDNQLGLTPTPPSKAVLGFSLLVFPFSISKKIPVRHLGGWWYQRGSNPW